MPYSTTATASSGRNTPMVRRAASITIAMAITPIIKSRAVCWPGRCRKMLSKKIRRYSEHDEASAAKTQSRHGIRLWLPS